MRLASPALAYHGMYAMVLEQKMYTYLLLHVCELWVFAPHLLLQALV